MATCFRTYKIAVLLYFYVFCFIRAQCPNTQPCECQDTAGQLILYCAGNRLSTVPTFSDTTWSLNEVTLARNEITQLPANAFKTPNGQGLNTKVLDLSENSITVINDLAFSGLENTLQKLILHVNSMQNFPTVAIQGLTNLNEIHFKGFNFGQLPAAALSSFANLEILSFDTCQLTTLNSNDFSSQINSLKEVLLPGNQFTAVPTAALSTLNEMTKLDMSRNVIQTIADNAFLNMRKLQELHLSQNGVNTISGNAFLGLETTLKKLLLNNNNEGIHESDLGPVATLTNLEELDLSYNFITTIPNQFFQSMSRLRIFMANANKINSLTSQSFQGLGSSFQELSLHDNTINAIEVNTFSPLNSLKVLILDSQDLSSAYNPDIFKGLEQTVETLSLTKTRFSDLHWISVAKLTKLKNLKLNENSISKVPDNTFIHIGQLESLHLQKNQINQLNQASFKGLQFSLKKIYLDNNQITTMHECLFHKFTADVMLQIHLDFNPLHCDCQIKWMLNYKGAIQPFPFWQCATPVEHQSKYLKDMQESDFVCSTSPENIVCEDYTITTTTQSSTSGLTPTGNYPTSINVSHVTDSSMNVAWIVYDTTNIKQWQVKVTDIVSGEISYDKKFDLNVRKCDVTNLVSDTEYSICVIPILQDVNINSDGQTCTSETTMPKGSGVISPEDKLQIILGIVFGVVFLLIILGVILLCYIRWRNNRDPPKFKEEDGISIHSTVMPTVGDQSRRFSKPKAQSMLVNMNGCTPQEMDRKLDGFTPDERDRILKLFSSSGASTLSMLSTASQRYTQEPYGEGIPNGATGFRPGYLNPMQVSQELGRQDSGEYQEIPADTYDEIPIDKVGSENGAYNMPYEDDRPKSTGDILGGATNYI